MELETLASGEHMAVEERGKGEPIVLLPGIIGARETWEPVADLLATTHRVLLVDLLGFGESSRPATADALWADVQARAVAEVLDARGLNDATLAGHDFGGPVAAHLLAARPDLVGRLCLCSTNVTADTPIPFPIVTVTWPVVGHLFERLLMSGPALGMMAREVNVGDASQRRSTRLIFGVALRELADRYAPIEAALRGVELPATVLWGGRDPFFDVEQGRRTAELVGCELELFESAGHFLPLEQPAEVAAALSRLAGGLRVAA